jgi:SAM-dependent methyltransferase
MEYDPIKRNLGIVFNRTPVLRKIFYHLLDLLLLRAWHVKREIKLWIAERKLNKESRFAILDAGSGFGQYTYFLSGLSPKWFVDAVDVKAEQIADCTVFFTRMKRSNVMFEKADLTKFSKPDKFDFILSVDVMEHIHDDELVFRNFFDSLTQGGMLMISTPSDQGGSGVHDHADEESFIDEHVRDGYNITEIQEKLKQAGFFRTEARFTYGKPGQMGWRLSMKYPIQMLNVSKAFFILLPFYYLLTYPLVFLLNYLDTRMHHALGTGLLVKAWK